MSLCPSSSHQLVAAAIAFRRARRKFPKDFGLESTAECASRNTKTQETATNLEGPINQARSSSTLVRRACNTRSDHVCPASVRNRDYDRFCGKENSISCSCCRTRNVGEDISQLRNECSGGDAVDTVPSKESGEFATSDVDRKNGFAKPVERDRHYETNTSHRSPVILGDQNCTVRDNYDFRKCDIASRSTDDGEAVRTIERVPQSARSTSYYHYKARCPSRPCSNVDPANSLCVSAPRERHDKVACGDFMGDRSKKFASTSCHGTSIDLDGHAEESVARSCSSGIEDAWTRANTLTTHRKIVDSTWRCQCEYHPRKDSILSRLSCDRCHDGCYHHHDYRCDCSHRHCCHQQCDSSCINAKGCETRGSGVSGEKAQHKSWRDQMRGENSRLYARQCYSKEYSGIIPASRERNDEERRERNYDDGDEDEDDDGGVAVINHKDSMCILAEKYKAGRKWRGRMCGDRVRSGDKDECNKSLTSEIIDQPESPLEIVNAVLHEGPSVKHVCRATHCENCRTVAIAKTCGRACGRHGPPGGEFDRLKSPLNETAATRCCSSRAPCRRVC